MVLARHRTKVHQTAVPDGVGCIFRRVGGVGCTFIYIPDVTLTQLGPHDRRAYQSAPEPRLEIARRVKVLIARAGGRGPEITPQV